MTCRLEIRPAALKCLKTLPEDARARVRDRLDELRLEPRPPGAIPLQGPMRGMYRIRVGEYRVVYRFDPDTQTVTVTRIGYGHMAYKRGS